MKVTFNRLWTKLTRKTLVVAAVLILVGGVVAVTVIKINSRNSTSAKAVIGQIGEHILLPKDEEPALVTVTDTSKLTTQFLKKTKNGDKVLIYQKNQKAIIYRPNIDKIIDVGPVVIDTPPIPKSK